MVPPPIRVSFERRREDDLQAARLRDSRAGLRRLRPDRFGYVLVSVGFFCFVGRREMSSALPGLMLMGSGGYVAITYILRAHAEAERESADADRLRVPMTVEADSDTLRVRTPLWAGEQKWQTFSDFAETRELFVLFYSPTRIAQIIPRRAFANEGQQADFRQLLTRVIQPPTRGFPVETRNDARPPGKRDGEA